MSRDVPILDLDVPLVEQLRGEGELLARGAFGLDEERAREKLQSFQLVSPHHYVLELLGCATLLGARHINYDVRARRVWHAVTCRDVRCDVSGDAGRSQGRGKTT